MTALQGWLLLATLWATALVLAHRHVVDLRSLANRRVHGPWQRTRAGRWVTYRRRLRVTRRLVAQLEVRRSALSAEREELETPLEFAEVGAQLERSLRSATNGLWSFVTEMALQRARDELALLERLPVRLWRS